MTTTTFAVHNSYEKRDYELGVTNGYKRVSISLRPLKDIQGLGASMTPADARALAADLIARAANIERHLAELEDVDEGDFGCDGHESLDGAHMGEAVYCDGSCRPAVTR